MFKAIYLDSVMSVARCLAEPVAIFARNLRARGQKPVANKTRWRNFKRSSGIRSLSPAKDAFASHHLKY
jgi:hypothetical protein